MHTFTSHFSKALTRIEVSGEKQKNAENAHKDVRRVLAADGTLSGWGLETTLIGSYRRHTGIYPGKDVDVFTKLTKLTTDDDPKRIFDQVVKVLKAHYGERAKPQRRSVKVDFDFAGVKFSVDAVPAVRKGKRWAIPARDTGRWADAQKRWIETDPELLTTLTSKMNESTEIDGSGAYVPVVKLVKQIRQVHLGKRKPGGLYFETMTYRTFEGGIEGTSYAVILTAALESIAQQLSSGADLIDVVMGTPFEPKPTPEDRAHAATEMARIARDARAALSADLCPAAATWHRLLGENGRGKVFSLPDNCGADGKTLTPSKLAATAVGAKEGSRFA